ncbi:MAG TPA: hypothetical protein ENH91_12095 [Leeuwenhoekiella sp.]|nr:hypothetical protein [Leeuwenhoekiella sp.]
MDKKEFNKLIGKVKKFDKFKLNTQVDLFIDLTKLKFNAKDDHELIKDALELVNAKLVRIFEKNGTQSVKQKGRLVYLHNQIWAGRQDDVDIVDAIAGLKKARLGKRYIKESVDMDKLHTLFRGLADEAPDGKPEIPENLKDFFKATEKFSIRSKKA